MGVFVDHSGRSASRAVLCLRGAVTLVVVLAISAVLVMNYRGDFTKKFTLTIMSPSVAEGLVPGADVKLRGYRVGRVTKIIGTDTGAQEISVQLDPRQVAGLSSNLRTDYTSSNLFGSTAIELVDEGGTREPLRSGSRVSINGSSGIGTVTGVLHDAGNLLSVMNSPQAVQMTGRLAASIPTLTDGLRSVFNLASGMADEARAPLSHYLNIFADTMDGIAAQIGPVIDLAGAAARASTYLTSSEGRERTIEAITGAAKYGAIPLTALLDGNEDGLSELIGLVLDLAVPAAYSVGTVPHAYDRLYGLLQRTSNAFVTDGGHTRLQIDVIMDNLSFLPASASGHDR